MSYPYNYILFTVKPYDPNSEISFLALSKLEESSASIRVLSAIECNAEKFKDAAGFSLIKCYDPSTEDMKIAQEHIESWKAEKKPIHKPTWSALLEVLKDVGLDCLAQEIDDFLWRTSPSIQPADELQHQEDGRSLHLYSSYDNYSCIPGANVAGFQHTTALYYVGMSQSTIFRCVCVQKFLLLFYSAILRILEFLLIILPSVPIDLSIICAIILTNFVFN